MFDVDSASVCGQITRGIFCEIHGGDLFQKDVTLASPWETLWRKLCEKEDGSFTASLVF